MLILFKINEFSYFFAVSLSFTRFYSSFIWNIIRLDWVLPLAVYQVLEEHWPISTHLSGEQIQLHQSQPAQLYTPVSPGLIIHSLVSSKIRFFKTRYASFHTTYASPDTIYASLYLPYASLVTPYATPHYIRLTPYASLHTPYVTLHKPHSTLLTPHSIRLTPHYIRLPPHVIRLNPHYIRLT